MPHQFEIGQDVRVASGPFTGFRGTVEDVDEANSRVKVIVHVYGRAAELEFEPGQIEVVPAENGN